MLLALVAHGGPLPDRAHAAPPDRPAAELPDRPVAELLGELRSRHRAAGAATRAYHAAQVRLRAQRSKVARLDKQLRSARSDLGLRRVDAGRLARAQYRDRTAGLTPYLRMALTDDPQRALEQRHLLRRAAKGQALALSRLRGGEQRLTASTARARKALARQRALASEQKARRDSVRDRLDSVAELLGSLSESERAEMAKLKPKRSGGGGKRFLATGLLRGGSTPSAAGSAAVEFAVRQIGKPYRWGATGPRSFDCSGLTSRAWAAAAGDGTPVGRARADSGTVPRTSQEQWRTLPRIELSQLRPGDLVVYFEDASHVALYLGKGRVVHAPRPGRGVKVSPVAANPVLGAVRPDPDDTALDRYTPPALPKGATDGDDTGHSGTTAP
ncbi:NlpC/P60 family protein [Streptomyces sp. XM4193]|uniref:C40 family peptidase n=1 Tax=Streptomyces sp. XM4193 TaxID=2929782 RepID=UPI001FF73B4B|nr:NlpC/P60 family protein [Streptomyces sp. XM4193]MCK1797427.1 NlpC/P60 family protein [Streptomyces sp. XM4193]